MYRKSDAKNDLFKSTEISFLYKQNKATEIC